MVPRPSILSASAEVELGYHCTTYLVFALYLYFLYKLKEFEQSNFPLGINKIILIVKWKKLHILSSYS